MQQAFRRGIPRAVTMGLGLVMGRVMVMRGLTILLMVMGQRVVVILMERGRARMGEQRKGMLAPSSVVNHHMHGGEKESKDKPTAYEAFHA